MPALKRFLGAAFILLILSFGFLSCSGGDTSKKEFTVLLKMLPNQEKFFRTKILNKFEKIHNCKVHIATFDRIWDIETGLKLQKEKKNPNIALVKTPFEMTRVLVGRDLMAPLTEVTDPSVLDRDLAEYHALALGLGYVDDKPYYVPRKLETRVMFYIPSKVKEAVAGWAKHKKALNTLLKPQNGYGLPKGYTLEADPEEWDTYDVLVAGYFWGHKKYFNTNIHMPRIAHRGDRYEGTALGLVDRAIQFGAETDDILKMDVGPVAEMLTWEAAFVKNKIFNPGMWEDPWRGSHLYEAIKSGKVFLCFLQQIDCFLVHGWENNPDMMGYLKDPEDFGLATMPKAVSFALNSDGSYKKLGSKKTTTGGWWWGVPKTAPHKELAYKLARFITNKENQALECTQFGMIPVRKDILSNLGETFSLGWVGDVFQVSVRQIDHNGLTTVPLVREFTEIGKNFIEAWYDLCVDKFSKAPGDKIDQNAIQKGLKEKYAPNQKRILKDKYPQS